MSKSIGTDSLKVKITSCISVVCNNLHHAVMPLTHRHLQTVAFFNFGAISGLYHIYIQLLFVLEHFSFQSLFKEVKCCSIGVRSGDRLGQLKCFVVCPLSCCMIKFHPIRLDAVNEPKP